MDQAVLEVTNLSKSYGELVAVAAVSLRVDPREVVVLVGPNGSGKTTTMECVSGLRRAGGGEVRINGQALKPGEWRQRGLIGVQLQESGLPPRLRVQEAFEAVASLYRDPADIDPLLEQLRLTDSRRQFYERLSGGQKRRVNIGLALLGRPPLVLLDEPTSGIDPEGRAELWSLLRRICAEGTGILLTTHDLSEAEDYADRIVVLNRGRVVLEGSMDSLLQRVEAPWRLRVLDGSPAVVEHLSSSCSTVITHGDQITVFADRETLLQMRATLEGLGNGSARPSHDVVCGPVRLEDLFLLASHE